VPGLAGDADAVVSGTPVMLYELLVLGDTSAAEISGDPEVVEELIRALAPTQPLAAPTA